tara:strand:+ start:710 stop:1096 length:387 start_codon:yes stop_codon:yes gene_type:complete
MAEGFARDMLQDETSLIDSAGIESHGLNYLAVKVMKEVNIDITHQVSQTMQCVDFEKFDLIVTVCDHANQNCPSMQKQKMIHKNINDPALSTGTIEEQLIIYRNVRDLIQKFVSQLLENYDIICLEQN